MASVCECDSESIISVALVGTVGASEGRSLLPRAACQARQRLACEATLGRLQGAYSRVEALEERPACLHAVLAALQTWSLDGPGSEAQHEDQIDCHALRWGSGSDLGCFEIAGFWC